MPVQLRDGRQLDSIIGKGFITGKKKPAGERAGIAF